MGHEYGGEWLVGGWEESVEGFQLIEVLDSLCPTPCAKLPLMTMNQSGMDGLGTATNGALSAGVASRLALQVAPPTGLEAADCPTCPSLSHLASHCSPGVSHRKYLAKAENLNVATKERRKRRERREFWTG
jgi:hypothetical protein